MTNSRVSWCTITVVSVLLRSVEFKQFLVDAGWGSPLFFWMMFHFPLLKLRFVRRILLLFWWIPKSANIALWQGFQLQSVFKEGYSLSLLKLFPFDFKGYVSCWKHLFHSLWFSTGGCTVCTGYFKLCRIAESFWTFNFCGENRY